MDWAQEPAVRLCGRSQFRIGGRHTTADLPGRQGRLLLAYLVCNRRRPVRRDELIDLLWPSDPPAHPDEVLGALLSKLRRALGAGVLEGRRELTLILPPGASVDVDVAEEAIELAEASLAAGAHGPARDRGQAAMEITGGGFMPGVENPWVQDRRRELDELRLRALECIAAACLGLGGGEVVGAERAARELIAAAPLREPGYKLLMDALEARGDVAGAVQVYEELRVRLRDELGIAPGPVARAAHERLLTGGDVVAPPVAEQPEAPDADHSEQRPAPVAREERKLVTVLAAELKSGAGGEDPEELRVVRARAYERARSELERFGGMVERTADGAALAVFGVPAAHEDDADRAVLAALRLRDIGLLDRGGVASGEVLVVPAANAPSPTGRAVDDAIRLAHAAGAGAVLADDRTLRATRELVTYDRLGPEVAAILRTARRRPSASLEHAAGTPFVGRTHELASLESLWRAVVEEARPRLVTVLGDAGVGKSRLVDELVTRVQTSAAASVYRGRCLAYGEGATYWPLNEILRAATGIRFDDAAATAAVKLRDCVCSTVGQAEADRVSAALALGAGVAVPDNPLERLSPEAAAAELALAWPAFLSGLARQVPLVAVIEDVHWAEVPLFEMVERILVRSDGPLLLVLTARPAFVEMWSAPPGGSQIALEPLTDAQSRQLVAALLPQADPELRERVVATAEGNPFFAEELVSHLSERQGDGSGVPNTVRALLAARVDALPEAEKELLQDAAVIGRVFWTSTLESVEPRTEVDEMLRALERRGLVVTKPGRSPSGETELAFRHGLIREIAYRSIPRARRCHAHAAVGRWLEQLAGDRREEFVDLLAHHFEAAVAPVDAALAWTPESREHRELRAKAVEALLDAGDAARRRVALEQALTFARRAAALTVDERERLRVLELEARTHHAALHGDEALAAYTAGMQLARALGEHATLARLRAHAILLCVRYAGTLTGEGWHVQAREMVDEAAAESRGEATFDYGVLMVAQSWDHGRLSDLGLEAARRLAERAIALAERLDAPELLAAAVEGRTWLSFESGFCEARVMGERLVRASRSWPDRVEAHESLVSAAMSLAWAGEFDRAAGLAREASEQAVQLSGHRKLHSAAAETMWSLPTGSLPELGEATTHVVDLVRAEGRHACGQAIIALAGRVLWLFEAEQPDAASDALELLYRVRPPAGGSLFDCTTAQALRPVVGPAAMRRILTHLRAPRHDGDSIVMLRVRLPVLALSREWDDLEEAIGDARRLASSGCAPALGDIAEWAAAVHAAERSPADAVARARAAASALANRGERYTAARLLADFVSLVDDTDARRLGVEAAAELEAMGARASAAEVRGAPSVMA